MASRISAPYSVWSSSVFASASAVAAARVPRLVYVSCDPATLAGDLRVLAAAGYALRDAVAFDLFPQTPHVEALVVLEHAGRDC